MFYLLIRAAGQNPLRHCMNNNYLICLIIQLLFYLSTVMERVVPIQLIDKYSVLKVMDLVMINIYLLNTLILFRF